MKQIIAFCGLTCSECPAYIATQAGDKTALERVAADWRVQFKSPAITAESIVCDGCTGNESGRLAGYCSVCDLRKCGMSRGLANCAYCSDYACDKLDKFLEPMPQVRAVLDNIKASL
jgi:hypothetical protein